MHRRLSVFPVVFLAVPSILVHVFMSLMSPACVLPPDICRVSVSCVLSSRTFKVSFSLSLSVGLALLPIPLAIASASGSACSDGLVAKDGSCCSAFDDVSQVQIRAMPDSRQKADAAAQSLTRKVQRPLAAMQASLSEVMGRLIEGASSDEVEQVHLSPGGFGEMKVQFMTRKRDVSSDVMYKPMLGSETKLHAVGKVRTYTSYICPDSTNLWAPSIGEVLLPNTTLAALVNTSALGYIPPSSQTYFNLHSADQAYAEGLADACLPYGNPLAYYQSPYIHSATLTNLVPGVEYSYQPVAGMRNFSFKMPPAHVGREDERPLRIGLWADVGVTHVSEMVMQVLKELAPDFVVLIGDYCYADGYSHIWDYFGRIMEPLFSSVPMMGTPGDHEMTVGREQGTDWMMRYNPPFEEAGSDSPLWYSHEVGPVHMLGLAGSFSVTSPGSPQFEFVKADLERVNRTQTPWLVVFSHIPWYNSNKHHHLEGLKAQRDFEQLFYDHGVDLIVSGHVHSYERSHPVFNFTLNKCAPTYLNCGDGGNYEGPDLPWREPQPSWSAFREGSFGAGVLVVHNSTHAVWEWKRAACVKEDGGFETEYGFSPHYMEDPSPNHCFTDGDNSVDRSVSSDEAWIVRDTEACSNRA